MQSSVSVSPKAEKIKQDASPKHTRSRSRSVGRPRSRLRSPARVDRKETVIKREGKTSPKNAETKAEEGTKATNSVKKYEVDSVVKCSLTREKIGSVKSDEVKATLSSVTTTNSVTKNLYISLEKNEPSEIRSRSTRLAAFRRSTVSPKAEKIKQDATPKRTRSRSRSVGRPRFRSRSPARVEKKETVIKRERKISPKNAKTKSEECMKATNSVKKDEVDSVVKSSLTCEKIGSVKSDEVKATLSSVKTTNSVTKNLYISLERNEPRSTRLATLQRSTVAIDLCIVKLEKLGISSMYATYEPNETEESRLLAVQRCNGFMVHACQCIDTNCTIPCRKIKRVIQHTRTCTHPRKSYGCTFCRQLISLCCYHAKYCQEAACPVLFCLVIKEKMQHRLQQADMLK